MVALRLVRRWFTDAATEGELSLDGERVCWTLEDRALRDGEPKVAGRSAIPPGRYRVTWAWSPRFQRQTLRLHDVPGFEGILIHAGNRSKDTEGCILVGLTRTDPTDDWIGQSGVALAKLEAAVCPKLLAGEPAEIGIAEATEIDQRGIP